MGGDPHGLRRRNGGSLAGRCPCSATTGVARGLWLTRQRCGQSEVGPCRVDAVSQRVTAAAFTRCRSVTDRRSCYDRASRANSKIDRSLIVSRSDAMLIAAGLARALKAHPFHTSQAGARSRRSCACRRGVAERRRWRLPSRDCSMPNKMLIDATHPEETRVVVLRGNRVEEFDFESANRKQLRGNIYLAKVTRVEPSLQAAFVDYGGNRHGFLAFSEIHPDYYQIPVADRQALIDEEERAAARRRRRGRPSRRSRRERDRERQSAARDATGSAASRSRHRRRRYRGRRRRDSTAEAMAAAPRSWRRLLASWKAGTTRQATDGRVWDAGSAPTRDAAAAESIAERKPPQRAARRAPARSRCEPAPQSTDEPQPDEADDGSAAESVTAAAGNAGGDNRR